MKKSITVSKIEVATTPTKGNTVMLLSNNIKIDKMLDLHRLILQENGQADEETGEKFILSWRFSSLTDCPNNRETAAYQG